jgi:hypothetical protein
MTDRQIVYAGAVPRAVDQLLQNINTMTGLGWAIRAFLGTGTLVDGLSCVPNTPSANMTVNVNPGAIYSLQNLDNTAYGSLAADTTAAHQIMKQGLMISPINLSCPAPASVGQSINYLIEAAYEDLDTGALVLPYYNSANPASPFSGPSNTGISQATVRQGLCVVQAKAGVAATTGSQTTPAVDSGFVPLFVVTVAQSTSSIGAGNIFQAPGAPFINTKLPNARTQLTNNLTLFVAPAGSGGSDSNTGLAALSPFLTLQKAWNFVQQSLDLAGFSVTVQMAAGTYTASLNASGALVGSPVTSSFIILGNTSSPSTVTLACTSGLNILAQAGAAILIQGLTLSNSGGSLTAGLFAQSGGSISFSNMVFGAFAGGAHLQTGQGGSVTATGPYTISGGAQSHALANVSAPIILQQAVTLTGTPAFSIAFASAQIGGVIQFASATFTGSATGVRFSVNSNGVIVTNGAGATFLPGSAAGASATGGEYV